MLTSTTTTARRDAKLLMEAVAWQLRKANNSDFHRFSNSVLEKCVDQITAALEKTEKGGQKTYPFTAAGIKNALEKGEILNDQDLLPVKNAIMYTLGLDDLSDLPKEAPKGEEKKEEKAKETKANSKENKEEKKAEEKESKEQKKGEENAKSEKKAESKDALPPSAVSDATHNESDFRKFLKILASPDGNLVSATHTMLTSESVRSGESNEEKEDVLSLVEQKAQGSDAEVLATLVIERLLQAPGGEPEFAARPFDLLPTNQKTAMSALRQHLITEINGSKDGQVILRDLISAAVNKLSSEQITEIESITGMDSATTWLCEAKDVGSKKTELTAWFHGFFANYDKAGSAKSTVQELTAKFSPGDRDRTDAKRAHQWLNCILFHLGLGRYEDLSSRQQPYARILYSQLLRGIQNRASDVSEAKSVYDVLKTESTTTALTFFDGVANANSVLQQLLVDLGFVSEAKAEATVKASIGSPTPSVRLSDADIQKNMDLVKLAEDIILFSVFGKKRDELTDYELESMDHYRRMMMRNLCDPSKASLPKAAGIASAIEAFSIHAGIAAIPTEGDEKVREAALVKRKNDLQAELGLYQDKKDEKKDEKKGEEKQRKGDNELKTGLEQRRQAHQANRDLADRVANIMLMPLGKSRGELTQDEKNQVNAFCQKCVVELGTTTLPPRTKAAAIAAAIDALQNTHVLVHVEADALAGRRAALKAELGLLDEKGAHKSDDQLIPALEARENRLRQLAPFVSRMVDLWFIRTGFLPRMMLNQEQKLKADELYRNALTTISRAFEANASLEPMKAFMDWALSYEINEDWVKGIKRVMGPNMLSIIENKDPIEVKEAFREKDLGKLLGRLKFPFTSEEKLALSLVHRMMRRTGVAMTKENQELIAAFIAVEISGNPDRLLSEVLLNAFIKYDLQLHGVLDSLIVCDTKGRRCVQGATNFGVGTGAAIASNANADTVRAEKIKYLLGSEGLGVITDPPDLKHIDDPYNTGGTKNANAEGIKAWQDALNREEEQANRLTLPSGIDLSEVTVTSPQVYGMRSARFQEFQGIVGSFKDGESFDAKKFHKLIHESLSPEEGELVKLPIMSCRIEIQEEGGKITSQLFNNTTADEKADRICSYTMEVDNKAGRPETITLLKKVQGEPNVVRGRLGSNPSKEAIEALVSMMAACHCSEINLAKIPDNVMVKIKDESGNVESVPARVCAYRHARMLKLTVKVGCDEVLTESQTWKLSDSEDEKVMGKMAKMTQTYMTAQNDIELKEMKRDQETTSVGVHSLRPMSS